MWQRRDCCSRGLDTAIPVILCTGYNDKVNAETVAQDLGIQGLLMKPYDLKQLSVLVRSVLDGGGQ